MKSLCAFVLFGSSVALALPAAGDMITPVAVSTTHGAPRTLPDPRYPIIVIYEDERVSKTNERADKLVDQIASLDANAGKVEGVPVADVERWNWFPAKTFALAEIRKIEKKLQSPLYTDFPGELRKRWGLAKAKSSILVIAPTGRVLFAAEGPLDNARLQSLGDALKKVGVAVPAR
jgi:hypothetical protein